MRHSLKLISGLGEKRITILNSMSIHTIEDLIRYVPRRYIDRTKVVSISEIEPGDEYTAIVFVKSAHVIPGRMKRLLCKVYDETGDLEIVFFNAATYMQSKFQEGTRMVVSGTISDQFKKSMIHPDVTMLDPDEKYVGEVVPVYPLTEEMKKARVEQKFLKKIVTQAFTIPTLKNIDEYPDVIMQRYSFVEELVNLKRLHAPETMSDVHIGLRQLKLQELLPFTVRLAQRREQLRKHGCLRAQSQTLSEQLTKSLPFTLTGSQSSALQGIFEGMNQDRQFHGLIQGDVGSGKTVVAFCAIADVIEMNMQAALMAPTEILAWQHYLAAQEQFNALGKKVAILTGSVSTNDRKQLLNELANGTIDLLVGTHALFSKDVEYNNLGLAVIDEQHRFGVDQRAQLLKKGQCPDMLAMSATPIPRSLTMSLYGDLTPIIIAQKPEGRKEILTRVVPSYKREGMKTFIQKEVDEGGQVYWVVPRIESSEEEALVSVDDLYDELSAYFNCSVAYLHGKTDEEYKRETLGAFNKGEIKVLVSTTVIEVGVNVPAATVMVIEGADRFGLAQLHQLRGRVGRGTAESWCFLLSESENRERLDAFSKTNDGFDIAEMDLSDRGSGNLEAYDQSGVRAFKYFDFIKDFDLIEGAVSFSEEILTSYRNEALNSLGLVKGWLSKDETITHEIS